MFEKLISDDTSYNDFFSTENVDLAQCKFENSIGVQVEGCFGEDCWLYVSHKQLSYFQTGKATLKIKRMGGRAFANNVNIILGTFTGNITVHVDSAGSVFIGECGQLYLDLRVGYDSLIIFGDKCTSNGTRVVAINSSILIKKDVMLSDEILLQGFDQHGIVDIATKTIINDFRKTILINSHVWVGRRATIMPGVTINSGSIVAACAVVTSNVPEVTIFAGVPAKAIRENVTWTRPWNNIDKECLDFLEAKA